jgi:AP-4 complex subunit sigma-1
MFSLTQSFSDTHPCWMWQLEQVHFLLDEMVMNGRIVDTNKHNILKQIDLMDRESQKAESMYR